MSSSPLGCSLYLFSVFYLFSLTASWTYAYIETNKWEIESEVPQSSEGSTVGICPLQVTKSGANVKFDPIIFIFLFTFFSCKIQSSVYHGLWIVIWLFSYVALSFQLNCAINSQDCSGFENSRKGWDTESKALAMKIIYLNDIWLCNYCN